MGPGFISLFNLQKVSVTRLDANAPNSFAPNKDRYGVKSPFIENLHNRLIRRASTVGAESGEVCPKGSSMQSGSGNDRQGQKDARENSSERQSPIAIDVFIQAFRSNPAAIVITRARDGLILEINESCESLFGFSRDEVIGRTTQDLNLWPDKDKRRHLEEALRKTGSLRSQEVTIRNASGLPFTALVSAELMTISGEDVLITTWQDITAKKQTENALLESNKKLEMALRSAGMGVWRLDLPERKPFFDDQTCRLLGINPADFNNTSAEFFAAVHPEDRNNLASAITQAIRTNSAYKADYRAVWPDGSIHFLTSRGQLFLKEDGQQWINGLVWDVSERKRGEDQLSRSENLLRAVTDNSPEAIYVKDRDSRWLMANPTVLHIVGRDASEALGKTDLELYDDQKIGQAILENDRRIMECGASEAFEELADTPEGRRTFLSIKAPWRDGAGKVIGVVGISHDITERKRAEKALRDQDERMQALFKHPNIGIVITSPQKGWLEVNDAWCQMIGYSRDELKEIDWPAVTHPEDLQEDLNQFERLLSGAIDGYLLQKRFIRKDGTILYTEISVACVRRADRYPEYMVTLIRDITARKEAEEALRVSEEKFSLAFSGNPAAIALTRMSDGAFLEVNDTWLRLSGYDREELIGGSIRLMDLWPDSSVSDLFHGELKRKGSLHGWEQEFRKRSGELSHGQLSSNVLSVRGEPVILTTLIDITKRKLAEKELTETTQRLHLATAAAKAGVWDWHLRTNEMIWDARMLELYGLTPDTFPGGVEAWEHQLHPDDLVNALEDCQSALRGERDFDTEFRVKHPDGSVVHIQANGLVLRDGQGEPFRMIGLNTDITEIRRTEAEKAKLESQLQQAQKMESVGRLAGGVAHDYNNMLGVILGHTELALEQVLPSQPLYDDLIEIQKAAQRSADLTRQLLAFARKQPVAPQMLNLNESLSVMARMLQRLIGEAIRIDWKPGNDLWSIQIDPSQIDQIMANLAINARDAIQGVGVLTIETANVTLSEEYCVTHKNFRPGDYVLLTVGDTGSGMNEETLQHIFEPFFTTKEIGKGTGLGLSTVYGIIRQNSGHITVESRPGMGTAFRIYLPRFRGSIMETSEKLRAVAKGQGIVLLVEDEGSILRLTTRMLEGLGYTVLPASTPDEAIYLAQEYGGVINILLTDIVMPNMNGRDLANRLLSLHPRISTVFMSGWTADIIAHQGIMEPGIHFLQKPFSRQQLAETLQRASQH